MCIAFFCASHCLAQGLIEFSQAASAQEGPGHADIFSDRFESPQVCRDPNQPSSWVMELLEHEVFSAIDKEQVPPFEYAGQTTDGGSMPYIANVFASHDLWKDGNDDIVVPLTRGYAAPVDNRTRPLVFRYQAGRFTESGADIDGLTELPGARRISELGLEDDPFGGLFMVQHGGSFMKGDSLLLSSGDNPINANSFFLDPFPMSQCGNAPNDTYVNAHSLAGGDLNGNRRTDFVVGDWGAFWDDSCPDVRPFFLLQASDGSGWRVHESDFLADVMRNEPMQNLAAGEGSNLLIDLHVADLNGSGLGDLVVGWGHGSAYSKVFFNQGGASIDDWFSRSNAISLPSPPFGADNSLHLRTYSLDISGNNALDLLIVFSRYQPYYSGYAFQVLINDGTGIFTDETAQRMVDLQDREAIEGFTAWSDNFQFFDVNGNGHLDLVGSQGWPSPEVRLWVNDGRGFFSEVRVDASALGAGVWATTSWIKGASGHPETLLFEQTGVAGETADFYTKLLFSHYQLKPVFSACQADECCL